MGRIRLIASLTGIAALLALLVPASALAGTYTWSQPGDFSGAQGALKYGVPSWTYEVGGTPFPAGDFSGGAWSDGAGNSISASGTAVTMTTALGAGSSVSLVWTNPTGQTAMVSASSNVSGTFCIAPPVPSTVLPGGALTVSLHGALLNGCSATGTISITAVTPAPSVSLTSPTNNATITGAQPTFSGSASTGFGVSGQVKVHVYSGSSASGTPLETVTTNVSGGKYSVSPNPALNTGTYTARAEQDDAGGGQGLSSAVTFTVSVHPPTVTLDSLGKAPLRDAAPTLHGTAGTASGDASSVAVGIFPGTDTTAAPVRFLSAPVGSDGHFSIVVSPALGDGQYTAYAAQAGGGGAGYSAYVTFVIKVHPPALTLNQPASGASVGRTSLAFAGQAGNVPGDSRTVTLYLYRGSHASGRALGKLKVHTSGGSWSTGWPHRLLLGFYTVRAVQSDDAGHTAKTKPHTFVLVPSTGVIGAKVTLSHSGSVAVPVGCGAPSSQTCTGTVLVVTQRSFQTSAGGPTGPLQVLFTNVQISGGTTQIVRGSAPSSVVNTLSRFHTVGVTVTVKLSKSGGGAINDSVGRTLTIT